MLKFCQWNIFREQRNRGIYAAARIFLRKSTWNEKNMILNLNYNMRKSNKLTKYENRSRAPERKNSIVNIREKMI